MKDANRLKVNFSFILGDDDLANNMVSIKNMETGNQEDTLIDNIINYF